MSDFNIAKFLTESETSVTPTRKKIVNKPHTTSCVYCEGTGQDPVDLTECSVCDGKKSITEGQNPSSVAKSVAQDMADGGATPISDDNFNALYDDYMERYREGWGWPDSLRGEVKEWLKKILIAKRNSGSDFNVVEDDGMDTYKDGDMNEGQVSIPNIIDPAVWAKFIEDMVRTSKRSISESTLARLVEAQDKKKLLSYLQKHVGLDVGALTNQINEDRDVKYIVTKLSKTVWQRNYMSETAPRHLKGKDKIKSKGIKTYDEPHPTDGKFVGEDDGYDQYMGRDKYLPGEEEEIEQLARDNVERHLGDLGIEDPSELGEEAYTLAWDGAKNAGATDLEAQIIATKVKNEYGIGESITEDDWEDQWDDSEYDDMYDEPSKWDHIGGGAFMNGKYDYNKPSYWGKKGTHQDQSDKLWSLIPGMGEVEDHENNPALERYRVASAVYYDIHNNGPMQDGLQRSDQFVELWNTHRLSYDELEDEMDKIVQAAWEEQTGKGALDEAEHSPGFYNYTGGKVPHDAFKYVTADQVAETWDNIPQEIYRALWNKVVAAMEEKDELPTDEYGGDDAWQETPPDPGTNALADYWHLLSDSEQAALNKIAKQKDKDEMFDEGLEEGWGDKKDTNLYTSIVEQIRVQLNSGKPAQKIADTINGFRNPKEVKDAIDWFCSTNPDDPVVNALWKIFDLVLADQPQDEFLMDEEDPFVAAGGAMGETEEEFSHMPDYKGGVSEATTKKKGMSPNFMHRWDATRLKRFIAHNGSDKGAISRAKKLLAKEEGVTEATTRTYTGNLETTEVEPPYGGFSRLGMKDLAEWIKLRKDYPRWAELVKKGKQVLARKKEQAKYMKGNRPPQTKYKYTVAKQVGGDDGYQWTVIDKKTGHHIINGLTKPEVKYYRDRAEADLTKKYEGTVSEADDGSSEMKAGRRAAGSYGKVTGKHQKSQAAKKSRRTGKEKSKEVSEMAVLAGLGEGYKIMPPMDPKYVERGGLEGPFTTRSGKVVYYDPREGRYYDPDTDIYMSSDEYEEYDRDPNMEYPEFSTPEPAPKERGRLDDSYQGGTKPCPHCGNIENYDPNGSGYCAFCDQYDTNDTDEDKLNAIDEDKGPSDENMPMSPTDDGEDMRDYGVDPAVWSDSAGWGGKERAPTKAAAVKAGENSLERKIGPGQEMLDELEYPSDAQPNSGDAIPGEQTGIDPMQQAQTGQEYGKEDADSLITMLQDPAVSDELNTLTDPMQQDAEMGTDNRTGFEDDEVQALKNLLKGLI